MQSAFLGERGVAVSRANRNCNRIHGHYTRPMLADKALRNTFRNFSTLFLLAALVTISLHLVYGFIFRDVLEIEELHPLVRRLTPGRTINGIRPKDLEVAELWANAVPLIELLLLPLLVGATRRVLARDSEGEVPTVIDALKHPRSGPRLRLRLNRSEAGAALAGIALGAGVWFLTRQAGLLIAEPLPDPGNFVFFALVYGIADALGLALFLGGFVTAALESGARRSA